MSRQTLMWSVAALLGIVVTAALTWSASQFAGERVGISSEALSITSHLAPQVNQQGHAPAGTPRPSRSTTVTAPATPLTTTTQAVPALPTTAPQPAPAPSTSQPSPAPSRPRDDSGGSSGAGSHSQRDD